MRGQGSLEYLLIGIAAMGFVAIVFFVLNSMLAPGLDSRGVQMDVIECGENHVWLKEYVNAYDGSAESGTHPGSMTYYGATLTPKSSNPEEAVAYVSSDSPEGEVVCKIQGEYNLTFSSSKRKAWLEVGDRGQWNIIYEVGGGGGSGLVTLNLAESLGGFATYCGGSAATNTFDSLSKGDVKFGALGDDLSKKDTATVYLYFGYALTTATVEGTSLAARGISKCDKGCAVPPFTIDVTGYAKGPVLINIDPKGMGVIQYQLCGNSSVHAK